MTDTTEPKLTKLADNFDQAIDKFEDKINMLRRFVDALPRRLDDLSYANFRIQQALEHELDKRSSPGAKKAARALAREAARSVVDRGIVGSIEAAAEAYDYAFELVRERQREGLDSSSGHIVSETCQVFAEAPE